MATIVKRDLLAFALPRLGLSLDSEHVLVSWLPLYVPQKGYPAPSKTGKPESQLAKRGLFKSPNSQLTQTENSLVFKWKPEGHKFLFWETSFIALPLYDWLLGFAVWASPFGLNRRVQNPDVCVPFGVLEIPPKKKKRRRKTPELP